jgi:hypothetical protein
MSTIAAVDLAEDLYIPGAEALRKHPTLSRVHLYRLVAIQRVRAQLPAGAPIRYHAADLARVMSETAQSEAVSAC